MIDSDGTFFIERENLMNQMGDSSGRIGYLINISKKYSEETITDAINLLVSNEHIKFSFPENTTFGDVMIVSTAKGAIAYRNEYYLKESNEILEKWPKVNWIIATIVSHSVTLIVGAIIGIVLAKR